MGVVILLVRILQIIDSMDLGGAQTFVMNLYRSIDRKKIQFDFLVTTKKRCAYDDEIIALGGRIYHVSSRRDGIIRNWTELNTFFKTYKYTCVHFHTSCPSYLEPLIAAKKSGVDRIILHSHSSSGPNGLYHRLMRRIYRPKINKFTSHYFACSELAANWMYGKYLPLESINIIPNGIDAGKFVFNEQIRKSIRKELKIENKLVIGHVGRFAFPKNHEFLIDIFKAVHDKKPDSILIMIGDGELRSKIQEKVNILGLNKSVIFTGTRSDIPALLQAMDIFVMPSHYEGLPVTLVEAQAAGLPCIVSDNVTKEIELTDLVKFISLESNTDKWSDLIIYSHKKNDRKKYNTVIKESDFDISKVCRYLENLYISGI